MTDICCLDSDDCLSLDLISQAFRCGIKEEHSWALIYQSLVSLNEYLIEKDGNYRLCKPNKLFIRSNGTIHCKSWHSSGVYENVDLDQVILFFAQAVYMALDYGIPDDEEMKIPSDLELIFSLMTQNQVIDEGIDEIDSSNIQTVMKIVEERCETRVMNELNCADHYRNVCRALVAEAIEMSTFLNQISKGTQELKRIKNVTTDEVDEIHVEVWAHLWMRVMRQLRNGVSLKTIDKKEFINSKQREYELTPFEMLLDDIKSNRYSLKKVEMTLPKQVEKDARTMILEFIRSRPPLKPVSERVLSPPNKAEPSLHQKLMDGIKQSHQLKPTPKLFERKYESFHLPRGKRFSIYNKHVAIDGPVGNSSTDNIFQRFSFRNLSLRSTVLNYNIKSRSDVPLNITPTSSLSINSVSSFWRRLFKW